MNSGTSVASRTPAVEIARLRSAAAVRARCEMVHRFVAEGHSPHFTIDASRLDNVAGYVAQVTRENYPDLVIPYHSRWRHFCAGGIDRWQALAQCLPVDARERARVAIDLVTVSVLLDAGAGNAWRYREVASGAAFTRSEGLAVASFDMFGAGAFSSSPAQALRVDDAALARLDAAALARQFQVDAANPLVGLEARCALLRRLGHALAGREDMFGRAPARPGNLVDYFSGIAERGAIPAATVLATLLDSLASIWPSGLMVDGVALGDAGRHRAVRTGDATNGIVPFHKLSQWLTYSLIEPLTQAGLKIERLDELTALPEYRNGGLLIDLGAIRPRTPIDPQLAHDVHSEIIVEWRALTIALMDRLLAPVRARLGLDAELHAAAYAARRNLERGTQDRARAAPARRCSPHRRGRRRHRVLGHL